MNREENPQSKRKHQRTAQTWTTGDQPKKGERPPERATHRRSPSQTESRRHSRGSR